MYPKRAFYGDGKSRSRRISNGLSIVEMLVTVVVMGIAMVGLTELLWVNTSWASFLHNKYDNFTGARTFLNQFENDVRHASKVQVNSDGKQIFLEGPFFAQFDSNGYITGTTKYTYSVIPDLAKPGQYKIIRTQNAKDVIVLSGLIGPKTLTGSDVEIFQYVERGKISGEVPAVTKAPFEMDISEVIVNLELRNDYIFGKTAEVNTNSFIALRSEVFVRNSSVHGQ